MSLKKLALFFAIPFLMEANPENPTVSNGGVRFDGLDSSSVTVYPTDQSIIHWDSFSIAEGEVTTFVQPNETAACFNRVTGTEASALLGRLEGNGMIYLINPNGILIGKEGVIDVGGFIASAFDIPDDTFLKGESFLLDGSGETIRNEGRVTAKSGEIFLFAHRIENTGTIDGDTAVLAAGHRILFGMEGKNFLYIAPEVEGGGIENAGTIDAIKVALLANADPMELAIQNTGRVHATDVVEENGEIFLVSKNALFENRGDMIADEVRIEGENATLENYGSIIASKKDLHLATFADTPILSLQKPLSNHGKLEATKGSIYLQSPKFENSGEIFAKEKVGIFAPGAYLEMGWAKIQADAIEILAGNYFSSGKLFAKSITLTGERISARAARYSADEIAFSSYSYEAPLYLNPYTKVQAEKFTIEAAIPPDVQAELNCGLVIIPESKNYGIETSSFDPNPEREPLFWFSMMLDPEITSMWKFWSKGDMFSYFDEAFLQTACPPSPIELIDPNASGPMSSFGFGAIPLTTGNVIVVKPFDSFAAPNAGAVYLYNAETGLLISTLRGSTMNDNVGSFASALTGNGNAVVLSTNWSSGAGAATFFDGNTGVNGTVSAANSLIGTDAADNIGSGGVTPLGNGNYVVISTDWSDGGTVASAGAVSFGNGTTGVSGMVSAANSLVGASMFDAVGSVVTVLGNNNYVVGTPGWDDGGTMDVGAATLCDGTVGTVGPVSTANSLHGSQMADSVGNSVVALTNNATNNYVVGTPNWANGGTMAVGAATLVDGSTGIPVAGGLLGQPVTTANSLIGVTAFDSVGNSIIALDNGNYVVGAAGFTVLGMANAGAATPVDGVTGIPLAGGAIGQTVTTTNSLFGTTMGDRIGEGLFPLSSGRYIVLAPEWDNGGTMDVGSVTPVGANGIPLAGAAIGEAVSTGNSIHGTQANDRIGNVAALLQTGNYVVLNDSWANGPTMGAGSVTFALVSPPTVGPVSATNSLVGTTMGDFMNSMLVALSNGNYIVNASGWDDGPTMDVGAVAFGNGTTGVVGPVTSANSLIGSQANDLVGAGIFSVASGEYIVASPNWANGGLAAAGAFTIGDPNNGTVGVVSSANSIVGTQANDQVSAGFGLQFGDTEFILNSPAWNDGATMQAGAISIVTLADSNLCDGTREISSANSFVGANMMAGLQPLQLFSVNTRDDGTPIAAFTFQNFNGESRVFTILGDTPVTPSAATATFTGIATSQANYSAAVAEAFFREYYGWLTLKGTLDATSPFAPAQTYKGLNLILPSLVINE